MRDGWEDVALGQLICRRSDFTTVDPDADYVILGVQRSGWGFVQRDPLKGRDQKFTKLMRIKADDLVYRTITAFEAPSAVAGPEQAGLFVTPQTFPVYTINSDRLLPAYMRLLTTWASFHDEMAARCSGTVLRRKTLSVRAFESIPVPLPPLLEQRWIVDLIGAIDDTIASAEATASNARRSATSMLIHPLWEIADTVPLESVFEHVIGGTWGDPPGLSEVPVLALGPKSYAGRVEVDADTTTLRSLPSKRAAGRMLRPGDIVLERSGGSPTQPVGRVIRMSNERAPNVVPSDFQRLLRPDPSRAHPDFVFWSMWANYESGLVVPFQKATTSIRNLNIPQYLSQVRIALPAPAEQVKFAALAESCMALVKGHERQASQLLELRSSLLMALLSGQHEIPKSYDELMEVAS